MAAAAGAAAEPSPDGVSGAAATATAAASSDAAERADSGDPITEIQHKLDSLVLGLAEKLRASHNPVAAGVGPRDHTDALRGSSRALLETCGAIDRLVERLPFGKPGDGEAEQVAELRALDEEADAALAELRAAREEAVAVRAAVRELVGDVAVDMSAAGTDA